jgi:putative peptide zinc metalloprotease protein
VFLKTIHELSHAYTATAFGARVRSMGIAFMVFCPIPFCDITDGWRLSENKRRAQISGAGVCAELVVAALSLLLWNFTEPGIMQSIFFLLSSASIVSSFLVNLNPAMRFDGYYLLSDIMGVENLQPRAFAVIRWFCYKLFFNIKQQCPEYNATARRIAIMVVYAFYTVLYRIGLYLGIAALVYYKFTKVLGIILFSVEIMWFIIRPIINETKRLLKMKKFITLNPHTIITGIIVLSAILFLCIPFSGTEYVASVTEAEEFQNIYVKTPGKITKINATKGKKVKKGDILFQIENERQKAIIKLTELEADKLKTEISICKNQKEGKKYIAQKKRELARILAKLEEIQKEKEQNTYISNINGTIFEWDDNLRSGTYVNSQVKIGKIYNRNKMKLISIIPEDYIDKIAMNSPAWFYPANGSKRIKVKLKHISSTKENVLLWPQLSSSYGGEIPTHATKGGSLIPTGSFYRMQSVPSASARKIRIGITGTLHIKTKPKARIFNIFMHVKKVLLRESSF